MPAQEWDALAARGFDLVYLMGVWERSAFGRHQSRTDPGFFAEYDEALPGWTMDDVLGSPFAVRDYRPDPAAGDWADLAAVRTALHDRGMGLVLDLVPNHTAPDHAWVRTRPECYVHGRQEDFRADPSAFHLVEGEETDGVHRFVARGRDPLFPAWPDTAQLDYARPETRALVTETIRTLAGVCDGLRCDMAMLLLDDVFARTWEGLTGPPAGTEFWAQAIGANPGLLFIAEAYWGMEPRLQDLGFQYTYDKSFSDLATTGALEGLRGHLRHDPERQWRHVRFLENHDEPRANERLGQERMEAAATLLATLPGMRFFHHGQLEGRRRRLPVRLRATADETDDATVAALLGHLLRLADHPDFHGPAWRLLDVGSVGDAPTPVAYAWEGGQEDRIVVANPGARAAEGRVALRALPETEAVEVVDDLHERTFPWRRSDLAGGLYVRLEAFRAHVLRICAAPATAGRATRR